MTGTRKRQSSKGRLREDDQGFTPGGRLMLRRELKDLPREVAEGMEPYWLVALCSVWGDSDDRIAARERA